MIITISGPIGSGKSSVAKLLAKKLKYKHHSTGDLMRQMAKEKKMTLEQLGDLAAKDFSIDQELDERQKQLGKKEDNFVIDGRLSFHFIPQSLKIYLDADPTVRAKRVFQDLKNRPEEAETSLEKVLAKIKKRQKIEIKRYLKYYQLDHTDKRHYDLLLDTSEMPVAEVVDTIIRFVKNRLCRK
ncbi:cytidylate kinase [Candidatus Woesearchaeota archaeon CG10_big_fil_rev_8_21_14_0_10_45_16]|nr:MAG: cytidylate kinase [Candidatus Woesearchaeota archaeon CG10_big_fil_rev_8_21_14_0_10_45_16]